MCDCRKCNCIKKDELIPFDLARAKAGEPFYRFYDLCPAIDFHHYKSITDENNYPFHASFDDESVDTYTTDGHFDSDDYGNSIKNKSESDLVMKKNNNTEELWIAVKKHRPINISTHISISNGYHDVNYAKRLFSATKWDFVKISVPKYAEEK